MIATEQEQLYKKHHVLAEMYFLFLPPLLYRSMREELPLCTERLSQDEGKFISLHIVLASCGLFG